MPTDRSDLVTKQIFTTGKAATICKLSQQTIIRCFDNGQLQGFRVPRSRFRRILQDQLIRFMCKHNILPTVLERRKKRILMMDVDPKVLNQLVDVLTRNGGYEVKTAATGNEAGVLTESFKPHLILLDDRLPNCSGESMCKVV